MTVSVALACASPAAEDGGVDAARSGDAGHDAGSMDDDGGASDDAGASEDGGASDGGTHGDAGSSEDAGPIDAGAMDAGSTDDAGSDAGSTEDAGTDAGPMDPCTPLPSGLTTWTRSDSASTGTPDTYFFDVTPGDPFCASITGGGSGSWSLVVSNGTSSGVYCTGSPTCSIVVPPGQTTLLVTAVTTDIGSYTLTVRYRPR